GSSSSRWQCAKNATELLNFRLLPRLKNIGSRRLHRPDDSLTDWRALGSSLTTRDPIAQRYDQIVKYATWAGGLPHPRAPVDFADGARSGGTA
ncbi:MULTISPECIES: transposase, partial [unclassified Streptomyces]|uniref:transposase n=1 Tax=unclassified Streptomyces TaxID=2593676 RepID=UPI000DC4643D